MSVDRFWAIVENGKLSDQPHLVIADRLRELSPQTLLAFQTHLDRFVAASYRQDLWGAAYRVGGGCSDDCFVYFRYGLISKGREVYERALADPDSLADLNEDVDLEDEDFGCVAQSVYEEKTGGQMPRSSVEHPLEPSGEEWDFGDSSEVSKRLPRLEALMRRVWDSRVRRAEEALKRESLDK